MSFQAKNEVIRGCTIENVEYRDAYEHLTFDIHNEKGEKLETVQVCNREIHQDLRLLFRVADCFGLMECLILTFGGKTKILSPLRSALMTVSIPPISSTNQS